MIRVTEAETFIVLPANGSVVSMEKASLPSFRFSSSVASICSFLFTRKISRGLRAERRVWRSHSRSHDALRPPGELRDLAVRDSPEDRAHLWDGQALRAQRVLQLARPLRATLHFSEAT